MDVLESVIDAESYFTSYVKSYFKSYFKSKCEYTNLIVLSK